MNVKKISALLLASTCAFGLHAQLASDINTVAAVQTASTYVAQATTDELDQFVTNALEQGDKVDREQLQLLLAQKFAMLDKAELEVIAKLLNKPNSQLSQHGIGQEEELESAQMSIPNIGSAAVKAASLIFILAIIDWKYGARISNFGPVKKLVNILNGLNLDLNNIGREPSTDTFTKSLTRAFIVIVGGCGLGGLMGELFGDTVALLSLASDEERATILGTSKAASALLSSLVLAFAIIDEKEPWDRIKEWKNVITEKADSKRSD